MKTENNRSSVRTPSFDAFYREHHPQAYRSLTLALRNPDLAREAADEAMTRALERWDVIGTYAAPEQWVFRVGLNWARSRLRRRRYESVGILVEPSGSPAMPDPDVSSALAALPLKLRAVVVLRLYLDWSTEDTGRALGIAAGTVKSRLSRALERLERVLEG
ncbi:MAG: RNA polymerase sigma factor [Acidimicrobiia bacterium]|nr:RNA polymerase sigma factor [Acidimicrobiia bacterium]